MTTTTTIKSVHIEGCWPYKYEAPDRIAKRRVFKRETMDRANARKREIYYQKKKLLGLQVFELDIDICKELNNGTR
jgi:hypothetical protein